MSETLFKEVHYPLGALINDIGLGRIDLPNIQRPFVWANAKVRDLFDSMYRGYLKGQGVERVPDINQIANYTLVEWDDNIAISDAPPSQYWPKYAERFDPETLAPRMRWHALPRDWWTLSYEDFLVARRPLIADVIRQGYVKLSGGV